MSIFDLPLEIQDMILDLEPQEALLALRATCSTALSQINPRVFSTVQLNYDLIEALANNLCTFTSSVKKICWKYDLDEAGTPQLFQYWSQLSHLPALKQLEIEVIGDQDELSFTEFPPLRMFHDLESLSVTFPGDLLTAYSEREIAVAISRSSNLRNLQILNLTDTPFFSDVKQCISLSAFLSSPVTALEKLQIHHVPFPRRGLRQVISSSLRELSVLTRNGGRGIKSNWGALWSTLGVSGARLSSLKVSGSEAAMDELFAYLTSYTGLRLLEISDIVMDGQEMEDCAGEKFWGEVVPHHYATLATLSVTPKYGGSWCYGPAAAASLRKCFSLRYLTISLGEINPSWARDQVHALQADGVTFSGAVELDEAPNSYVVGFDIWILRPFSLALRTSVAH
ncbi:uncharacterized protein N7483_002015 [Penicillium malachiteum]|uniref:uncharacterized protein n=1 Tax=Penicillium malachiteum TaxID=1324776 RepID=UPI002549386E|nr:uncharacterized protein N7483_002015 [Penicillium malachiteum]KAJ5736890.1 hypothetical protein N7483_002015 [Penicillium malachiteum]